MKKLNYLAAVAITIFGLTSCNNDDNTPPVNEEEVITTVTTTLTSGNQIITLTSRDLDGDGPNAPVISVSANLNANTVYNGTVSFLNEIANPVDDITVEVEEEGDDHQVFFQAPNALGTFTYNDFDTNAKPVGLNFTLTTANATNGNLVVTLIHLPNKNAEGVSAGMIANADGATDAQVTYPVVVQ